MENLGVLQTREKLLSKEFSVREITEYYINRIEKNKDLNAYITVNEGCLKEAENYDNNKKLLGEKKLAGTLIAIKDVFSTKNFRTTCASKTLDNYIPQIESTVTERVFEEGSINIGKTNLDQFCHGSSTITSAYGASRNPWDKTKLPGGSSGGSAVAVAADLCSIALGTETAGSIRQPASWCGVIGMKPTYGRVSRYGVLPMGSSLDSPGIISKNVEDAAYLLSIISGHDKRDFTSLKAPVPQYHENICKENIKGMKLGIPKQYVNIDIEKGVKENFEKSVDVFKKLGAQIIEIDLIDPKFSIAVYTIVCRSEVASNLSRYDGTRYGLSTEKQESFEKYIKNNRGEGFGEETKRRIMTGTFSLSSGYADKYYRNAENIRQIIKDDLLEALKEVNLIIAPTNPTTAVEDEDSNNPLFGELSDVLVEASSLSGLPGISVPNGMSEGLPTGLQIFGKHLDEQKILDAAKAFEDEIGFIKLNKF